MQKTLLALAVLATSGAAMAQSSVTLFGTVDAAVTIYDGEKRVSGLGNSGVGSSALGFRGVEDLGGGAKAEFWLEGALSNDDGTGAGGGAKGPGFEFKRRASLSLHTNLFEMRMGRYLTAAYQATSRYDPFGTNGVGASQVWSQGGQVTSEAKYQARQNNMVGFYSKNYSGFKFALNSGFGEKSGDADYLGGSVTYDNGPLSLGLGMERTKSTAGIVGRPQINNPFTGLVTQTAIASVAKIPRTDAYTIGGAYDFGGVKLSAAYLSQELKDAGEFNNYLVGLTAKVGAMGTLKFTYNRYDFDAVGAGGEEKADQLSLGYVQALSKRTDVYGTYAYIKNKNNGGAFGLGGAGVSNGSATSNLDNGKMHGLQVGVRHSF